MLHFLSEIFPTGHDWGTWVILFTAGYTLRKVYLKMEAEEKKLKRRIRRWRKKTIGTHVVDKHENPLESCSTGDCALLSSDATLAADHF